MLLTLKKSTRVSCLSRWISKRSDLRGGAPARAPDQAPPQAAPVTPPLSKTATTGIPPGAYCEAGFDAFSGFLARPQTGSPSPPSVALIYDNCLVGDVIVIPGG